MLAVSAGTCAPSTAPSPELKALRVIAFGDSLVSGAGATRGNDFVSVLSRQVSVNIINAGRSGDTTASALDRLDSDVLTRDPDIVIVVLGGNDLLQLVPLDQRKRNLTTIAERIQKSGARGILVGLGDYPIDPYGGALPEIAKATSSAAVPDVLMGILGNSALMADFIHPNDAGHRLMADRIAPTLRTQMALVASAQRLAVD